MGLLAPLPVPLRCGESWAMDFITGLPTSSKGNNAILTFTDRLSKLQRYVACKDTITAEQTMELFFENIFRHYGLPRSIVSDRDPRFVSSFWQALWKRLGTQLNLSTANHPETDGQSERTNQVLEDMLRTYVSSYQDDWEEHLVTAEFAYNDSVNATTGFTPFFLMHGRHSPTPLSLVVKPVAPAPVETAEAFALRVKSDVDKARVAMRAAQERYAKYANLHRRDFGFNVGDQVWLSAEHLKYLPKAITARQKLRPRYYGPYKVMEVIGSHRLAYRLQLPPSFKIHPVIHISHLKANKDGTQDFPARPEYQPVLPDIIDGKQHWEVEAILAHKKQYGHLSFLIKWAHHSDDYNDWVFAADLKQDLSEDQYDRFLNEYHGRSGASVRSTTI